MTYASDSTWRKIQPYLPAKNRLTSSNLPEEKTVPIGNAQIHLDCYKAQKPKATIILFHGVGGNGRLLSFIAVPLNRQGYEVVCPDFPPYGYSSSSSRAVSYEEWVGYGVEIATRFQKPGIPLFLFGLSAGGMLAYQVAGEVQDVCGVIATCLLDQRIPQVAEQSARHPLLASVGKPVLGLLHKPFSKVMLPIKAVCKMSAIVNNTALAKLLQKDKKSSGARVSVAFLHSLVHPTIKTEAADFKRCPILLVHPQKDNWVDVCLSRLFFDQLACEKELRLLAGAGHFPIEPVGLAQLEQFCIAFIQKHSNHSVETRV